MGWPLGAIAKLIKTIIAKIMLNKFTAASLAICMALVLRKTMANRKGGANEIKIVLENISKFYDRLKANEIKSVSILPNSINYRDIKQNIFQAIIPKHAQWTLELQLMQKQIDFNYLASAVSSKNSGDALLFLIAWGLIGFLFYSLFIAESSHELSTSSKPQKAITFQNIIGLEQSKQALNQIIQYMKDPQKFQEIGARMRRGIIFYGPSGTGKTTLAKATAGEAGVPFFSCNASQFCEMYVGIGPKRVRDLFKRAKEEAPSIIYIDEIDAIGNRKQTGIFNQGSNSEKNSTINQLLSEMDGFASQQNVLVIGSTNRVEMIDQSLLRAGRFDLKIRIPLPNDDDRFKILKYHLQNKNCLISDQSLRRITFKLQDWSGADLQNLANESVYMSIRKQSNQITQQILLMTLNKLQQQLYH